MMRGQRWRWGWGPKSGQSGLSRLRSPAAKVATSAAPTLPPSLLSIFAHHPSSQCPLQNTWSILLLGSSSWLSHCPLPVVITLYPLPMAISAGTLPPHALHFPLSMPIAIAHYLLPNAHCLRPLINAAKTLPPYPLHLLITHHPSTQHILSGFGMLKSLGP